MHLVDILLPRMDNSGEPFAAHEFDRVREELVSRFGGVTAFLRSPASGLWHDDSGALCSDEIVIFEVMTQELDKEWWKAYRRQLEKRFRQKEIMMRAVAVERL